MTYAFGAKSKARLATAHPVLALLFNRVIVRPDMPTDITITAGHRGKAEQDAAFASRNSKLRWPNSKHNKVPSLAVDAVPIFAGKPTWDWTHYHPLAAVIKDEWAKMQAEGLTEGFTLSWGGDWTSFKDGPHWELRS